MEPAGIVMPFAGSTAPQGYLLCDGSAVSRDTYSALFTAIGTVYGAGDGATTFNLPDLSGRVVLGVSQSHALGSTGGEAAHILTENELPAHSHVVPAHSHENDITATTPVLSHSITQPVFKYNKPNQSNTSGAGDSCIVSVTTATASRTANLVVSNHASAACAMSGSVTDKAPFDTGSAGLGTAHNNMQPYTTVCYIISTGV
jgi:microcystin-dependent protein